MPKLSTDEIADLERRIAGAKDRIEQIASKVFDTPVDKMNQAAAINKRKGHIKEWEAKLAANKKV